MGHQMRTMRGIPRVIQTLYLWALGRSSLFMETGIRKRTPILRLILLSSRRPMVMDMNFVVNNASLTHQASGTPSS